MKLILRFNLFLIITFLFLLIGVSSVSAKGCCCYVYVPAEDGSFGVTTESTHTINGADGVADDDECRSSCYSEFANVIDADKYSYQTTDLIIDTDDDTPVYCFNEFAEKGNKGTEVDYEFFLGCGVVNGDVAKLRYLTVHAPIGHIWEGFDVTTYLDDDDNESGYVTVFDKTIGSDLTIEGGDEISLFSTTSFSGLSIFWKDYMRNFYFRGDPPPAVITEFMTIAYPAIHEDYEGAEVNCTALYNQTRGEFERNPQNDEIYFFEAAKLGDLYLLDVGSTLTMNVDDKVYLKASSSFEPVITGIEYSWQNTNDVNVTIFGDPCSGCISGNEVVITANSIGSAVLSVKSTWGGTKSVSIVVQGFGMDPKVAEIKSYCLSMTSATTQVAVDICNEIVDITSISEAVNTCKSVGIYLAKTEVEKELCEVNADAANVNEKKASGLLKSMEDKLKAFPSLKGTSTPASVLIGNLVKYAMGIIGSLAFAMFIYGGILFMFSAGDKAKYTKGLDIFLWAGIGLLVIFGSYTILHFIISNL